MDYNSLNDLIKYNVNSYRELKRNLEGINDKNTVLGIVMEVSKNTSASNTTYSFGSVKVLIPHLTNAGKEAVWARPLRSTFGSFELPKIGSIVMIYSLGDILDGYVDYYYQNSAPMDHNPFIEYGSFDGYFNPEEIGFTFKPSITFKGYIGGRYTKNVMEDPGNAKLIASTNTFVFYQTETNKQVELKGANDYQMKLHVGDRGQIRVGYLDEVTDSTQTGSADLMVDLGIEGNADISTIDGNVTVQTTTGEIKLQAGNNYIKITTSGIYIVGDTFISGETMISKNVHWMTDGFSLTPTPPAPPYNLAQANTGKTHMHPTAVPGPPSPPTPGT